jgi:predicted lipoprotein with Yx(FWY)xxD motif
MKRSHALTVIAAAALSVALAGCGGDDEAAAPTPTPAPAPAQAETDSADLTVRSTRFGRILFDGRDRVLYAFTRDRQGGPSQCYDECATAWPVYFAEESPRAGEGVEQSLIGTTKRRDGRLQVTYDGWPLYYYVDDGPGEVLCQNVREFGGLWLVVEPSGRLVR